MYELTGLGSVLVAISKWGIMGLPASFLGLFLDLPLAHGFLATVGSVCLGGVLLALLTWFGKTAVENHHTPRRMDRLERVEEKIGEDLTAIREKIARMPSADDVRELREEMRAIRRQLEKEGP